MDLLLDKNTHDMVFVNGGAPVTQLLVDVVAQRLKITLYTFLGEWFLDRSTGVPYLQSIFGKVRNKQTVDLIFQQIISKDPDVIEILTFESSIPRGGRGYEMKFSVRVLDNTESLPITITVEA